MDGHNDFTITRLQAGQGPQADRHPPAAPSPEAEGEAALRAALASPLAPAPSTAGPAVPLPAGGEDLLFTAGSPSSASPREPGQPRHDLFTPERQAQFLSALAETGSVRGACARVGVSAQTAYLLRRRAARFAAGWDAALILARRVAEDVLAVRALDGVEEPVFYRGEQVGARVRFDARLLLAHLARLDAHAAQSAHGARRAERFDELLALVAGAEPPPALAPRGERDDLAPPVAAGWEGGLTDPLLPPERTAHVERMIAELPGRASDARLERCAAAAEDEWDGWRAAATARADRLMAGPSSGSRGTAAGLSGSGGGSAGGRAGFVTTLSGVSTTALCAAGAARQPELRSG